MIDADSHEEVFVFDCFFGAVWGLALSSIGDYFVAVSADKSIRLWRQTSEQVFISDLQELRQEKVMLKEAEQEYAEIDMQQLHNADPFARDKVLKIEEKSTVASKQTAQNIRYGEDLMSALELADNFRKEVDQYAIELELFHAKKAAKPEVPRPSPHFLGRTVYDHILL